jgi:hypothetical protein
MDLAKGGTLPSELKACNTSQKSVTRLVLICPLTSRIKIIYGCIVILRTNILIGRVMRSLHVSILDSSNIMLIIEWNVEYSTEIDDSIPCQRSRIFHPKLVEYANIQLVPCHLSSALFQDLPCLPRKRPCSQGGNQKLGGIDLITL